jgi:glycosyltransferase involved in cell wall biosynthesis
MRPTPLVTIVVPTYKAISLLPRCIETIIDATGDMLGRSILVRIQDGLSEDGVVRYINTLACDGVSIVSEQDSGIYDAMNKAVAGVTTPWVYFLGADDQLLPDFVEALSQLIDQKVVYYGNVLYSSDLKKYDGRFSPLKLVYRNICHQAIFFPSKILRENLYVEKYSIKADWASNIVLMSKYHFCYFNLNIAIFNNKDGISANEVDMVFDAEKSSIFRSAFGNAYYLLSLSAPLPTLVYKFFSKRR